MDRGPWTGVTGALSLSALGFVEGGGRRARAVVRGSRTLVDGLIEAGVGSFVLGLTALAVFLYTLTREFLCFF